jgi:hypothetical protein
MAGAAPSVRVTMDVLRTPDERVAALPGSRVVVDLIATSV